jgi:hypothetical protein
VQACSCVAGHAGGRAGALSWTAGAWPRALVTVQESARQPNPWMKPTRSLALSLLLVLHIGCAALPAEARGGLCACRGAGQTNVTTGLYSLYAEEEPHVSDAIYRARLCPLYG